MVIAERIYTNGVNTHPIMKGGRPEFPLAFFYPHSYTIPLINRATLTLPILERSDGETGMAFLQIEGCDFEVSNQVARLLSSELHSPRPETVVGIPTSGLLLARNSAMYLGHRNYVPLTIKTRSHQDDDFTVTTSSGSTAYERTFQLDPNLIDRIEGKKVVIIDDAIRTGASVIAAYDLVQRAHPADVRIAVVLTEGHEAERKLEQAGLDCRNKFLTLGRVPVFQKTEAGWMPIPETM